MLTKLGIILIIVIIYINTMGSFYWCHLVINKTVIMAVTCEDKWATKLQRIEEAEKRKFPHNHIVLYLAYRPIYKMVLGGFLIIFLSIGTWTWKITEVLFRHPARNFVIAESNMAIIGHDENPNFLGFSSTCKCNTTYYIDFWMKNSFPTLFWPFEII